MKGGGACEKGVKMGAYIFILCWAAFGGLLTLFGHITGLDGVRDAGAVIMLATCLFEPIA